MNNQEKNTYVRNMLLKTLVEMLEEKKLETKAAIIGKVVPQEEKNLIVF